MTGKQRAFADAIIAGQSPSQAYRSAYSPKTMSAKAISVEAQKLLANPSIALAVRQGIEEVSSRARWSREQSIERNRQVNDAAFERIVAGEMDKDSITAFTSTDRRLGELIDLDFEAAMRRRGIENAIENRGEFVIFHKMEWSELQQLMKDADAERDGE